MNKKTSGYLPVFILFCIALVIGMLTYQDYGIIWDEPAQRGPGIQSYNYVFNNDSTLFQTFSDNHGAAFELTLAIIEKKMNITKERDIYLMRHIVSHIVFLLGALSLAMLAFRLFGSRFLSCICFLMLVCNPRIYAHSFFNSKDVPFLAMVAVSVSLAQLAFTRGKTFWFLMLGLAAGYATGIRIMGIMLLGFVGLFVFIDLITSGDIKKHAIKQTTNLLVFTLAFCFAVYMSWPYLWPSPIPTFIESIKLMSQYDWAGSVLLHGDIIKGTQLPWYYIPLWFSITTPLLWLLAGLAGITVFLVQFVKAPLPYLKNTTDRNFLLALLCFFAPLCTVILFKSVLYDDWRHLYFVYPSFVLLAIYCFNFLLQTKFTTIVKVACAVQVVACIGFMVKYPRFTQVYFNRLVSHEEEYLRKNYELEYWGASYKLALDYLLKLQPAGIIKVSSHGYLPGLLFNNMMLLEDRDKARIQVVLPEDSDYFVTNFRHYPNGFPYTNVQYAIKVQNSTVLCVYKLR